MDIIDERGRLFGYVNIVDALVVLVVLAVVAAGLALVLSPDDTATAEPVPATPTNYATVVVDGESDGGALPDSTATLLQRGERISGPDAYVITDVYRYPSQSGTTQVAVRLRAADNTSVDLRMGTRHNFQTSQYAVNGVVRGIGNNSQFAVHETPVRLSTVVPAETAREIQAGDRLSVGDQPVATVEAIQTAPTDDRNRVRLDLGLQLRTLGVNGRELFAGTRVRPGMSIPLRTAESNLSGTVDRVGTIEPRGDTTNATVEVEVTNVRPEVADSLAVGQQDRYRGWNLRVVDRSSAPATVVTQAENGTLVETEHPRNRDVTLTLRVDARTDGEDVYVYGEPLTIGQSIVLDFEQVRTTGRVTAFDQR